MPACGESHDSDFIRVDVPFFRIMPDGSYGAFCVIEGDGVLVGTEPILEHDSRYVDLVKPCGDIVSFIG